ncbi:MAG: aldolase [Patescibacteria group bacterium]
MEYSTPLTVPPKKAREYSQRFKKATHDTGNLFLFAGDQKVEHMNDDFVGANIPDVAADPEHYFKIASQANIGVFATHLGLIARYGRDYKDVPYLVKLNGKTNLIPKEDKDPLSRRWIDVGDVVSFQEDSKLPIMGVGYTVYLGSEFESLMLHQAAEIVVDAHRHGMLAVLWIYPRGEAVKDEKDIHIIAGAAGVGLALGADFVKVNYPYSDDPKTSAEQYKEVTTAAGKAGVLCVGGSKQDSDVYLSHVKEQINTAGARGVAVGRNIYQNSVEDAIAVANSISEIVYS